MKSLTPRSALAALALLAFSCAASAADRAWINGGWFDGERFVARTVYTVGGRLSSRAPAATLPVEDLQGRYVVPPYGDAHHHGIDGPEGLDAKIDTFLRQGIFYVKNPNVIPDYLDASVRARLNRPGSIDVSFSNGGLTGSGGHPGPLHDKLAARGVFKGMTPADMENRARYLQQRGLVSNLELLRMWTLNTAATIFPGRRIGRLADGFEADFLVLDGDPIQDFANFQRIDRRVRAGEVTQLPQARS